MKKNVIALPLVAMALLGIAGCTAVVVPDQPQVTVTVAPLDSTSQDTTVPTPEASAPVSTEQTNEEPTGPSTGEPVVQPELDLRSDDAEGTTYYQANQRFSPLLDKWVINGSNVSLKQYTCAGSVAAHGTGTIKRFGSEEEEEYLLTWGPESSGVQGLVGRQLLISNDTLIQQYGVDEGIASTDKKVVAMEFVKMCGELGDTVLKVII